MRIFHHMMRGVAAALLMLAFVLQGTIDVLAGTTGGISGRVVDASTNQLIAGARVTAASPSQTVSTTSDASGRYTFLSLSPDTYTVSVTSASHDPYVVNGVTVQADTTQTVTLAEPATLKTIGQVTSRAASALVKPGTTADVYSINATTQDKASAFGGGGTLNSAYSAMSTVPGVFVAPNQNGYIGAGATLSIRGGDYDQIGYELDGIPVNRSFDNYPSGQLSALGQQELQVYTGAAPANSEGQGISGYINQVIKTGTAPAYRSLDLGIGSPTFYNKLSFETGGANPARTFSYYAGVGGYDQSYRYGDQYNGQSLSNLYGPSIAACPGGAETATANRNTLPSCYGANGQDYTNGGTTPAYVLGPYGYDQLARVQDRDAVVNLHFGLPKKDGTKDDIQLLFDNNHLTNTIADSTNDLGGAGFTNLAMGGLPTYTDAYQYNGPVGQLLPVGYTGGGVSNYNFPGSPSGRAFQSTIPNNQREAFVNDQSVVKAQYQHNFGTNAFLRVYGYTFYSDWLNSGPLSTVQNYLGPVSSDYELSSHSRGLSATFSDQLNSQHLLTVQGSYTTANTIRDNNLSMYNGFYGPNTINKYTAVGVLVDSSNPLNGICYSYAGTAVPCYSVNPANGYASNLNKNAGYFTLQQAYNGTVKPATGMCGGGPCQYLTIGNGSYATYNTVRPKFSSFSITDSWRPTDKLAVNLGLRFDRFEYDGSNTTNSPARTFWYNAYNSQFPTNLQFNVPSQVNAYNELQPRVGFTYTLNPATVVRASYGRYAQAPSTAFEQYDFLQPNAPLNLQNFALFGIGNTPAHQIRPPVSNNYDFSLEHQFRGDLSMKLTPFLRKTQDQIQQFYLDQKTSFVSGLNVGRQTSEGIEVELDKGDFARNGFAGRLAFTYTNSYINYTAEPNGQSVVDPINGAISQYNAFTKGGGGSPCYLNGAPNPSCSSGSIANPYYNAPTQALLNPNGKYPTFDTFPGGIESSYTTFGAPYVTTFLLQYKHDKLAITPALQFSAGQRYGAPETTPGINPTTCGTPLSPTVSAGDARYNYGAAGGGAYDATNCAASLVIPNQFTNRFDGIGAFVAPASLQLHLQTSYDLTKRVTLVANFSNIINRCFGGTKVPFAVSGACGYTTISGAGSGPQPIGNGYNPGNTLQPVLQTPYAPFFAGFPFNMYFEARIKV